MLLTIVRREANNEKIIENKAGKLPKIAQSFVREWLQTRSEELQKMWNEQKIYKLPPL